MHRKRAQEIYKRMIHFITEKRHLKAFGCSKKTLVSLVHKERFSAFILHGLESGEGVSSKAVLALCQNTMEALSGAEPAEGWLHYSYQFLIKKIYPHRKDILLEEGKERGVLFYLSMYRFFLETENRTFDPQSDFGFAEPREIEGSTYEGDYHRFLGCFHEQYIYELMRIGREIMPFDILSHVAGVHHIAMYVARQMVRANVPLDLGLVSGAAAGHDLGKYGCMDTEASRIPYLHYYYTDVWFTQHNLSDIGHIAANHSTWDLELENLPVESLVLIYADFRVKSVGMRDGKEDMRFNTLAESFQIILDKLDDVDEIKKRRYRHVYSHLVDFEKYMHSLGVVTDLDELHCPQIIEDKEWAVLDVDETVHVMKNLAFDHNIRLMHKLSRESSFGLILEAARSTRDWKESRAYLNIFAEYFTYMTRKQKQMTLSFLYEFMVHREGDIRRQAGEVLGNIIAHYDVEYSKELPQDASLVKHESTSIDMWKKYLEMIIVPDHKMIDRHRRWLGYGLKRVITSLLDNCKDEMRKEYANCLLYYYKRADWEEDTVFILIDVIPSIPHELLSEENKEELLAFMRLFAMHRSLEIRAAILLNLKDMADVFSLSTAFVRRVLDIVEEIPIQGNISLEFLLYLIGEKYGARQKIQGISYHRIFEDSRVVSDIFLDNLKAATPWKIKIINIELLYERISRNLPMPKLHVATHLSNLLKVSEQITVRHFAGETLVKLAPLLSWDQRNEIAIELMKGLEMGEFEFSKYIPQYLGEYVTYLHPKELDEFLTDLRRLQSSTNDRIASVALDTAGVAIRYYGQYSKRFPEYYSLHENRRKKILGMILSGFASYQVNVNREAFWVVAHEIFNSTMLGLGQKKNIFAFISKKLILLKKDETAGELDFFYNAVGWNAIYRFIGTYYFEEGRFSFCEPDKIAFFPGTFDPFSLSHKEIVREIRNMGFMVYLALDEFSWSKLTQPHKVRRRILDMSVADEENIYLFPETVPVNIANPKDLKKLREMFSGKEVYMVAGSDVVKNASSYRTEQVEENSILTFPHILFLRESDEESRESQTDAYKRIQNHVIELKLPTYFEDISSTRIRENIDHNRDISNLIDPVAQNYIYEKGLYLRVPQYKQLLATRDIEVMHYDHAKDARNMLKECMLAEDMQTMLLAALKEPEAEMTVVFDKLGHGNPEGILVYRHVPTTKLFEEFEDIHIASYIRENTSGKIVLFTAYYARKAGKVHGLEQLLLTEALAKCLSEDFTYAIFSPREENFSDTLVQVLKRQGFLQYREITGGRKLFFVDMKNPITFSHDVQTAIKEPLNSNKQVLAVLKAAHHKFQEALTRLYPGELVISFDAGIMHNRLVELITSANGVPKEQGAIRKLGPSMAVPFGKIMQGMVVPNTVTKTLHTEKIFDSEIKSFHIKEFPQYLPLNSQVRTVKSFCRSAILVDDLLHKGYRIRELDGIFHKEGLEIDRIIVGILSGRGRDLMQIQNRDVESAYFVPSLRTWFVETSMYPFIGGDSVVRKDGDKDNGIRSVNLILPYVMPDFLKEASKEAIFALSMVCLQNAKDILEVLEREYQSKFERSLTLGRLSEVIIAPRLTDNGSCMKYDYHLAPSVYLKDDIERLIRLQNLI